MEKSKACSGWRGLRMQAHQVSGFPGGINGKLCSFRRLFLDRDRRDPHFVPSHYNCFQAPGNQPLVHAPNDYMKTVHDVYRAAALEPDRGLCCTERPAWSLPDLTIPEIMLEMNYGCGSTVHPSDLMGSRPILYVGVGGGLEALQFAYFRRKKGGVIAV